MEVLKVSFNDAYAPKRFMESIKSTGFAVVQDHSIPSTLIDNVYKEWAAFFSSSDKHAYKYDPETQAGFFPFATEKAKDAKVADLKEFYHYYEKVPLPESVSTYTPQLRSMLVDVARTLLGWIEQELPDDLKNNLSEPLSNMIVHSDQTLFRIIHYPSMNADMQPGAVRAAAHEDINLITVLPASTQDGLELKDKKGKWHAVGCDHGSLAVNVGDMLQEAVNGYLPSTTHRVVNPPEGNREPRYSMPLFLHARPDVVLSPRYTAKTYLAERLAEIGLK